MNGQLRDIDEGVTAFRGTHVILLGILLLGVAFRLYDLGDSSIWYDEGATLYAATLVDHPLRLLDPDWCTDPPLLPLLTRAWWDTCATVFNPDVLTEKADFLLRLLPCLFSVAAIPFAFLLAREVTGSRTQALMAALLIAVSPFQIFYAQELKPYSSLTVLGIGVVYCMLRAMDRDRAIDWIGMTLFMILSMYNHFYSVWTIFACNVAFVLAARHRPGIYLKWVLSQCTVIAISWPAIRQGLVINRITEKVDVSWYPPLTWSVGAITFKNFFAGYSPNLAASAVLTVAATGLGLAGLWALRKRYRPLIVVCIVSVLPIVGNLALWQTREFSYYQHRLYLLSAILITILVGTGIASLTRSRLQVAALAVMLVPTLFCLVDHYSQRLHPSEQHRLGVRYKVDNRAVANLIHDQWEPSDAIVHFSHFTLLPLRYHYLKELPQWTIGFTEADAVDMIHSFPLRTLWDNIGALPRRLDTIADESQRIWLVESWWEPHDLFPTARLYRAWLDLHAVRVARYPLDGVTLYLYDRERFLQHDARAVQIADAGDVTIPYYMRFDPKPEALPGQQWMESFHQSLKAIEEVASPEVPILSAGTGLLSVDADTPQLQFRWTTINDRAESARMAVLISHETLLPLQFNREKPESDDWRPLIHGNPEFKGDLDEVAFAATTSADKPRTTGLSAIAQLVPGRYVMYARIWREVGSVNNSRAAVHITVESDDSPGGPQHELLSWSAVPTSHEGQSGWHWFRLGVVEQNVNSTVKLRIEALNEAGLMRAYADLGRICFLPETDFPPEVHGYGETVWRSVSRVEHDTIAVTAQQLASPYARLDVIIYDPDQGVHRSVALYLERE